MSTASAPDEAASRQRAMQCRVDSAPVPTSSVLSSGITLRALSVRMRRSSSPSSAASPVEPATSRPCNPAARWPRTFCSNPGMSSDSSALNGVTIGPITPPKRLPILPPGDARVRRFSGFPEHVHLELEVRRLRGSGQRDIESYDTLRHKVSQVLIESLHSVLLTSVRNEVADLANTLLEDEVADRGRHDEYFARGDAPLPVRARQQTLRNDSMKRLGQAKADTVMFLRREHRDHAHDRRLRVGRMERREQEVARFRGLHCRVDGFRVAQLA